MTLYKLPNMKDFMDGQYFTDDKELAITLRLNIYKNRGKNIYLESVELDMGSKKCLDLTSPENLDILLRYLT